MPKIMPLIGSDGAIRSCFFTCPGCGDNHSFRVAPAETGPVWQFNGNLDAPTFTPSLLVRSGCKSPHHKPGEECWCTFKTDDGEPSPFKCYQCHSIVTNGKIQFLSDCTHELAGQTVELPEIGAE